MYSKVRGLIQLLVFHYKRTVVVGKDVDPPSKRFPARLFFDLLKNLMVEVTKSVRVSASVGIQRDWELLLVNVLLKILQASYHRL